MPEPDYKEGDEKLATDGINHTFPDWYSWRTNNWGTKWEVTIEHWNRQENNDGTVTFEFNFDSAWSPPVGVYDTVSQRDDWSVFATYIEGGMDFMGYYEDGEDNSYQAATRTTTDAPDWLVDDYSWHYDQQEEYEQEDDAELVKQGKMTHEQFSDKWGNDTYDDWVDYMNQVTEDSEKKEKSGCLKRTTEKLQASVIYALSTYGHQLTICQLCGLVMLKTVLMRQLTNNILTYKEESMDMLAVV